MFRVAFEAAIRREPRYERRIRAETTITSFWLSRSQSRVLSTTRGLQDRVREQSTAPPSSWFGFTAARFANQSERRLESGTLCASSALREPLIATRRQVTSP
jgi:hypothetical protein